MKINGKKALVVGGSSGIGREFARFFAEQSLDVAIISRNKAKLESAKQFIEKINRNESKIYALQGDVTSEAFGKVIDETLSSLNGVPDYVVYTAGVAFPRKFAEIPFDNFVQSVNTNYLGFVKTMHHLLQHYTDKKINVIVISSMAALIDTFGYTTYAPTKIALRSFVKGLSYEYKDISFYVVYPIDTLTNQLISENETKPLETFLIDESGGITTPDRIVSYTMSIVAKNGKKNFYEIIPDGRFVYLVSKVFPWVIDLAVNSALGKAQKIRKEGREREVLNKMIERYRKKFEEYERKRNKT